MFDNEVDLLIAAARILALHHPATKNSVQNEGQNLLGRAWYAETVRRWDEFAKTNQELGADKEEALALMAKEQALPPDTICAAIVGAQVQVAKVGNEEVAIINIDHAVPLWVHYVHLIRALRCRPKI